MENATDALYMAAAFLVFIVAFTFSLYMVNKLNTTAKSLVYGVDETNYYDSLDLTDLLTDSSGSKAYKIVSADSIIPTLYKYYKESYTVRIEDTDGSLLQIFDTTVEGNINEAKSKLSSKRSDKEKALMKLYDTSGENQYLFGAPWIGSTQATKERIDMYISGTCGYINNVFIDYSGTQPKDSLKNMINDSSGKWTFEEIVSEYNYEGDTISQTPEGGSEEDIETLTGTKQTSSKIVITYRHK